MTPEAPAPGLAQPPRPLLSRAWRTLMKVLILGALAAIALALLYVWVATTFTYSSGERAGYVQKFSKKGWICKTWEGELAMAAIPGAMPEVFAFSLHDDAVAAEINARVGERVTLVYEQHFGLPSCWGDTSYWVTAVKPIKAP
jgi:hypothetical protein